MTSGAVFPEKITAVRRMNCNKSMALSFHSVLSARSSLYLVDLHLIVILSVPLFTSTHFVQFQFRFWFPFVGL